MLSIFDEIYVNSFKPKICIGTEKSMCLAALILNYSQPFHGHTEYISVQYILQHLSQLYSAGLSPNLDLSLNLGLRQSGSNKDKPWSRHGIYYTVQLILPSRVPLISMADRPNRERGTFTLFRCLSNQNSLKHCEDSKFQLSHGEKCEIKFSKLIIIIIII